MQLSTEFNLGIGKKTLIDYAEKHAKVFVENLRDP